MTGEATAQGRLDLGGDIADDASATEKPPVEASGGVDDAVPQGLPGRVVRVLPDVAAVGRAFDYLVPPAWENDGRAENLGVGSRVRVILGGRRVGAVSYTHLTLPTKRIV